MRALTYDDDVTSLVRYFPDDPRPVEWRTPIVAVGNFDGVHRGHAKILERICRQAAERQVSPLVLTFDPHPPRVVRPDKAPPLLMTPGQKYEALGRVGVHGIGVVRFSHEISQWEPEHFVRSVLVDWLRAAEVWVGGNFLFGRERSGNFTLLRALGLQYGFRAEKIDPVRYRDFVVSSTRARRLIGEGRVDEASALLGHHYAIDGHVVRGDGRGRQLGFPTANLATTNELLPPNGVYATMLGSTAPRARPSPTSASVRRLAAVARRWSKPTCSTWRAISTTSPCACGSCSGCATSARSRTSARCGSRSRTTVPRHGASSSGFRCRIDLPHGCPLANRCTRVCVQLVDFV